GRSEKITAAWLTTSSGDGEQRYQLFASGITQEPYSSRLENAAKIKPVIRTSPDGISMLDLAKRWSQLEQDQHPLVTTYGSFLSGTGEHPRSRFLLLIQALEGLYGHDHMAEWEERVAK